MDVDIWVDGCGYLDGLMWIFGWMDVDIWMDGCGYLDEWMDGYLDGWMDG